MTRPATAPASAPAATPWHRHPWPWLLALGPAAVVVAGTVTAFIAYTRQDALVVGDYYKQGKAINLSLRRDRIAADMGLHMALTYDAAAGKLQGRLLAKEQAHGGQFVLHLVHPTLPEKDLTFVAQADATGQFSLPLALLELGHWQVVAEDPGSWRIGGAWSWPKQRAIEIVADPTLGEAEQ